MSEISTETDCHGFEAALHDHLLGKVEAQYKVGMPPRDIEGMYSGFASPDLIAHCLSEVLTKYSATHVWGDPTGLDGREHRWNWYLGPSESSPRWQAYLEKLKAKGHMEAETLDALEVSTTRILNFCPNPNRASFQSRGLVMGHVQSGKTTNFIGLACKAADENYRLVIVLSGITNNLRNQTQSRVIEMTSQEDWFRLTDLEHDFRQNTANAQYVASRMKARMIAVVKKNKPRLTSLYKWLESMDPVSRRNLPVLIIDDECDQATTNAGTAEKRKAINEALAKIMDKDFLPKVAYVGYTATPYANLLADANDINSTYPKDFVVSLDKSPGYFGAHELFGMDVMDDEEEDSGSDIIRSIPNSDVPALAPPKKAADIENWTPTPTPTFEESIDWFILATSARRARKQVNQWSSMMVHTSSNVLPHVKTVTMVRAYLDKLRALSPANLNLRLKTLWEKESNKASHLEEHETRDWHFVSPEISWVLDNIIVIADNSKSSDRLNYDSEDERVPVIAVGGNTLSRGLTLEGLVSTYFLRTSNAYDSLMQMGRWFGYRPGYSDLQRIWLSNEAPYKTSYWFRELSKVEQEIRDQIEIYALEGRSPKELGIKIKSLPGMAITARAKQQTAIDVQIGYGGTRQQTILFDSEEKAQRDNLDSLRKFTENIALARPWTNNGQGWALAKQVSVDLVLRFIDDYAAHADIRTLRKDLVLKYIQELNEEVELLNWNVVIYSNNKRDARAVSLPGGISVKVANRSRMAREQNVNIKTLISLGDMVADKPELKKAALNQKGKVSEAALRSKRNNDSDLKDIPLLGIYLIDKDSTPAAGNSNREPLGQPHDLVGYYLVFPETDSKRNVTYRGPDLSPEEIDFEVVDDPYTEEGEEVTEEIAPS